MDALLLRFDGILQSYGDVLTDGIGRTADVPTKSMITGLLGNALGYTHRDTTLLNALQESLDYAVRIDRPGYQLRDYQTVDLGQSFMTKEVAWTTTHRVEKRGGASGESTHIRERFYWCSRVVTLAISVTDDALVSLSAIEHALREPTRPLFLGRKNCLPNSPILIGKSSGDTLGMIVCNAPWSIEKPETVDVWTTTTTDTADGHTVRIHDQRNWRTRLHVSNRLIRREVKSCI